MAASDVQEILNLFVCLTPVISRLRIQTVSETGEQSVTTQCFNCTEQTNNKNEPDIVAALKDLNLSHNNISALPNPDWWECMGLESLDLSHNKLGSLPSCPSPVANAQR